MIDATLDKINRIVPQKWQWVLNHEGFRKYFKNTGWMFFGQMFSLLVSFFIGAWLARYLGPENYGIFNYAVAFAGLFGFIAPLGVDAILNRDLIAHPENRDELMGTAFVLKLIGGILAFSLASLSAYFFETSYLIRLIVVVYAFNFILLSFNVISTFFYSKVESKNNIKVLFIASIISAVLKIVLITFGFGIIWLAIISTVEVLIQSIGFLLTYKTNRYILSNWSFDRNLAIKILKNSWFLMLALAASFIYLRIDQIIIGRMLGVNEVGLYAAAVKIADVWYFIPGIICSSLFPAIINAKKIGEKIYRHRLKNLYLLMFFLSLLIALPISIFSRFIILALFGKEYYGAVSILQIYVWAGVGFFLGTAINQYLISENKVKTIFFLNLSAMTLNILLNLYLIPLIGLNGAAFATLISYFLIPVTVLVADIFNKKYKK